MSTEHQQYSTENQTKVITTYARQRGYEVVASYEDGGKSGLTFGGRQSLKQLIQDVQKGDTVFKHILVYDISRWGRFLDADESAYYEFICKRAGVRVHYCNEQFENDGSIQANVLKGLKRTMAGEYSRELSVKVFQGQCNLVEKGYRQGGPAGYGLRRMLIDIHGQSKGLLKRGEHKSLQTDRVILVPGPEEEIHTVLLIYRLFNEQNKTESEIADHLNTRGMQTDLGRNWTRSTVRQVLTNEKYIGNNVYNRKSFKLKQKRVINPPDMWIRAEGAFEGIVDPATFYLAQGIIQERNRRFTNDEMIDLLRKLHLQYSDLTAHLIDETDGMPSSACYRARFGTLFDAYRLVGYIPNRDFEYIQINRRIRQLYPNLIEDTVGRLENVGASVACDTNIDQLKINDEYTAAMAISRCRQTSTGRFRWTVRFTGQNLPDITILVRMDATNELPSDFYLLPLIDIHTPLLRLAEHNAAYVDTYRFDSLDDFAQLALRTKIARPA